MEGFERNDMIRLASRGSLSTSEQCSPDAPFLPTAHGHGFSNDLRKLMSAREQW